MKCALSLVCMMVALLVGTDAAFELPHDQDPPSSLIKTGENVDNIDKTGNILLLVLRYVPMVMEAIENNEMSISAIMKYVPQLFSLVNGVIDITETIGEKLHREMLDNSSSALKIMDAVINMLGDNGGAPVDLQLDSMSGQLATITNLLSKVAAKDDPNAIIESLLETEQIIKVAMPGVQSNIMEEVMKLVLGTLNVPMPEIERQAEPKPEIRQALRPIKRRLPAMPNVPSSNTDPSDSDL